ncbi:hypothetical protein QN277_022530 [Acacia crassicarpa]|uniref:Uncharacterized protein n=1 Tax=Acacia crassicarpa TaxID=499986 RepID=A0AAE1MQS6_9FABA|nr:hypothetical protein QN277_022530 [Acacia crassicarpa]
MKSDKHMAILYFPATMTYLNLMTGQTHPHDC